MFRLPVVYSHLLPLCNKCSLVARNNLTRGACKLSSLVVIDNLHFTFRNQISLFTNRFSTDKNTSKTPALDTKRPKKQKDNSPIITLTDTENNQTVLSLSDAERLAKRRDLKLVNVDAKSQRPMYRLMTATQYYEEGQPKQEKLLKKSGSLKGEKLLTVSYRITEHDLSSRLKHINKWLAKAYEVRVVINGDSNNMASAEDVFDKIVVGVGSEGRVVQKRVKGSDIRFQILPPKKMDQQ